MSTCLPVAKLEQPWHIPSALGLQSPRKTKTLPASSPHCRCLPLRNGLEWQSHSALRPPKASRTCSPSYPALVPPFHPTDHIVSQGSIRPVPAGPPSRPCAETLSSATAVRATPKGFGLGPCHRCCIQLLNFWRPSRSLLRFCEQGSGPECESHGSRRMRCCVRRSYSCCLSRNSASCNERCGQGTKNSCSAGLLTLTKCQERHSKRQSVSQCESWPVDTLQGESPFAVTTWQPRRFSGSSHF